MSSIASYNKKVQISDDEGANWYDIPATSPSLEIGGDILDNTELATNAGYRTRIYGLHDWSSSADSNFTALTGDATTDAQSGAKALIVIRNAKLNRTRLMYRYLPTGSTTDGTGLQGGVVVENYGSSGEVGGLETVSISLQADGPVTPLENTNS